jgi:predicted transcriptional regulator YdeE
MKAKSPSFAKALEKQIQKHKPEHKLSCEYCGKTKEEFTFMIGAAVKADWCMHEGTGKISCPDCYAKAQEEATAILEGRNVVNTVPKLMK